MEGLPAPFQKGGCMQYFGLYRGLVVQNVDPDQKRRLQLRIPQVLGSQVSIWAMPCLPMQDAPVPAIGKEVWVMFEAGEADQPVWMGLLPPR